MRETKVEGEYQIDSWPKGPEWSLCPLVRPDIAMGLESQIEAWSTRRLRRIKTLDSHRQIASKGRRTTTVSTEKPIDHRHQGGLLGRLGGLGCQVQTHRGRRRYALDIPLHRRDLWFRRRNGSIDDFHRHVLSELCESNGSLGSTPTALRSG